MGFNEVLDIYSQSQSIDITENEPSRYSKVGSLSDPSEYRPLTMAAEENFPNVNTVPELKKMVYFTLTLVT